MTAVAPVLTGVVLGGGGGGVHFTTLVTILTGE